MLEESLVFDEGNGGGGSTVPVSPRAPRGSPTVMSPVDAARADARALARGVIDDTVGRRRRSRDPERPLLVSC